MAPKYQDLRLHINSIFEAAVQAADPADAVRRSIQRNGGTIKIADLSHETRQGKIFVISVGKAALSMGWTAAEILENDLFRGIIIAKSNQMTFQHRDQFNSHPDGRIEVYGGGHPISDENSIMATDAVIHMLKDTAPQDLVLCLISGGTSSLLTRPVLPLTRWASLSNQLLASGCTINELNTVRKRLDLVKGGGLAAMAAPARCISLILSDVVGNPLDVIGSGPTVQNSDPPDEARAVLDRYQIQNRLPEDMWEEIVSALQHQINGIYKLENLAENRIIGDVRLAAEAVLERAREIGFSSQLLTSQVEGEAREIGKVAAALVKDSLPDSLIVLGGETTVTVRGDGLGGRNQELALAAAISLNGWKNRAVVSFATDGDDGPTDAAGAFATGDSAAMALSRGIDPAKFLDNNDSYNFFNEIDGLIRPGPTGTNVNDIIAAIHYVN